MSSVRFDTFARYTETNICTKYQQRLYRLDYHKTLDRSRFPHKRQVPNTGQGNRALLTMEMNDCIICT